MIHTEMTWVKRHQQNSLIKPQVRDAYTIKSK